MNTKKETKEIKKVEEKGYSLVDFIKSTNEFNKNKKNKQKTKKNTLKRNVLIVD